MKDNSKRVEDLLVGDVVRYFSKVYTVTRTAKPCRRFGLTYTFLIKRNGRHFVGRLQPGVYITIVSPLEELASALDTE